MNGNRGLSSMRVGEGTQNIQRNKETNCDDEPFKDDLCLDKGQQSTNNNQKSQFCSQDLSQISKVRFVGKWSFNEH